MKKEKLFSVDIDFTQPITQQLIEQTRTQNDYKITEALAIILRQMHLIGRRPRTLQTIEADVNKYMSITNHTLLSEISTESIYAFLEGLGDVKPVTRRSRLKTLKAFLGKCNENGWLPVNFWKNINIKVDEEVKVGTTKEDIALLLSLLDMTDFIEFRDACAILLMHKTGIRIGTLAGLENSHIDFDNGYLNLSGDIMKNHKPLKIPIDGQLIQYLSALIKTNDKIRKHTNKRNKYVFISRRGSSIQSSPTHNAMQKRLSIYSKRYNLSNINAHAIRRGFATNLMKNEAPIALISKALGHSDLATTTKYLYLSQNEVAESLKDYL